MYRMKVAPLELCFFGICCGKEFIVVGTWNRKRERGSLKVALSGGSL